MRGRIQPSSAGAPGEPVRRGSRRYVLILRAYWHLPHSVMSAPVAGSRRSQFPRFRGVTDDDRPWTAGEAAAWYSVSESTIRRWVPNGPLPNGSPEAHHAEHGGA